MMPTPTHVQGTLEHLGSDKEPPARGCAEAFPEGVCVMSPAGITAGSSSGTAAAGFSAGL